MLNRRTLRIKAVQSLYAYHQCKNANYELAMDDIKEIFSPDLNSMEVQNHGVLKCNKMAALILFKGKFGSSTEKISDAKEKVEAAIKKVAVDKVKEERRAAAELEAKEVAENIEAEAEATKSEVDTSDVQEVEVKQEIEIEIEEEIVVDVSEEAVANFENVESVVEDAIETYHKNNKKDFNFIQKEMLAAAEKIINSYEMIMALLIKFTDLASGEFSNNPEKYRNTNLYKNQIVVALKSEETFDDYNWNAHQQDVVLWYKSILIKTEEFENYQKLTAPSLEDDRKIISHIVKKVIFKNELIKSLLEEKDIRWQENKDIVKSMVTRTLKSIEKVGEKWELEISLLSYDWEEDKAFFKDLFTLSVKSDEDYEQKIAEKTKNWDVNRLAIIDKAILKMALCEMINFPSIPVKVSINEYIEVSKKYSTPKSKQFINGLLDVMATELTESGVIKKSGRGLIDNK